MNCSFNHFTKYKFYLTKILFFKGLTRDEYASMAILEALFQ